jgi:hypothetical protein
MWLFIAKKKKTPKHLSTLKTITFIANHSLQNVPFKFAGDFDQTIEYS